MVSKNRRFVALLTTFFMILGLMSNYNLVVAKAEEKVENLAAWNLTADPTARPIAATEGQSTATLNWKTSDTSMGSYASSSLRVGGWNDGAGKKYWIVGPVDTKDYTSLSFSAKMRSSGTGPADFKLQFSTDNGVIWTDVTDGSVCIKSTSLTLLYDSLSLPKEAEDCQALLLRLIMTSNYSSRSYTDTTKAGEEVADGGISNINNIVITGSTEDSGEEVVVTSIADVRKASEGTFTVQGTVTLISGKNVYVQDSTGAIDLYFNAAPEGLALGDVIKATGSREVFKGLVELSGVASYEKTGTKELPCEEVTIEKLLADDSYQCKRVVVKNAVLGTINTSGSTNITQGENTIAIYRMPAVEGIKEGDAINLYGVVGWYNKAQLLVASASDISLTPVVKDPIPQDMVNTSGAKDIKEAYAMASGSATVIGEVAYKYGTSGTLNTIIIQDVIDGDIIGLQIYDKNNISKYNLGDIVTVTGTLSVYNGVTQISGVSEIKALGKAELFEAQPLTIAELKNGGDAYLSEYVVVKDATLGSYNSSGATKITDSTGTIDIFKGAAYPEGLSEGSKCDVYGAFSKYNSTYQLRNGASTDYVAETTEPTEPTEEQVSAVRISPNGGAVLLNTAVTLSCSTEGAEMFYSLDKGATWTKYDSSNKLELTVLPATLQAKAVKEGLKDSEITEASFTQRLNEKYGIYFGQIHSHTNYSDGAGTCEEAFRYASEDAEQIDFLAVTDHSNSLDNADSCSIADGSKSTEWLQGHQLADKYTTDSFVGIYGYEMTWSNGLGHMNTYNTDGFQSRTQADYSNKDTALQNYYSALKTDTGSISQFNHPGTTFGDFNDFGYYDDDIDALITLLEVGNGEGAVGSSGYFPSYDYYTRALDKGWHVAPTNNQDNHKGLWGDANTARTVALADTLSREDIYDAMRNMRVYATEDNDLSVYYTLDGYVMGTVLNDGDAGDTADVTVELSDPTDSSIGTVEVIVNGGMSVAKETVSSSSATVTFKIPEDYSYYYIRITQPDGDIAVTAPVWVGEVEAAGIAAVSTTENLPVKGQELAIDLELFNNEASPLEVSSIEFSIDGQVIHTVDLEKSGLTSVASTSTAKYSFNYTHDKAGAVNVDVTVKGKLQGVDKVYKDVLKLNYVVPEMVSKVIVDGTHYNDYVTGYYGGNMNNFSKLAATKYAQVQVVKDKITAEMLDDCDLLIISAPARKSGSANAGAFEVSHFEDEFVELVKNYVAKGGTLIVCGLADYQDTSDGQSSTEINKLLTAIGATTRLNSDEMVDDVKNGGQAYRLYLENFNEASPYTEGLVEGQKYSFYSGCSVLLDKAAVDEGRAEYLVKGFDSTYSIDSKTFGGNYTEIQKGNAIALAREELQNGANVFISGTVFLSDFEIQAQLDNASDLEYSNKIVATNILDSIRSELSTSTIAEARKGELGQVFAVEGTVTAGTAVEGNKFFDTIYIQDETGGITIFPYSESGLEVGAKVRVIGYVDEYQGDLELQVIELQVLDNTNLNPVTPEKLPAKDAMDYDNNGGELIETKGIVTEVTMNGDTVAQFKVKDSEGNIATIFIDGYILSSDRGDNTLAFTIKVGQEVSAVGLLYKHPEGDSEESVPCLRVRNLDEIKLIAEAGSGDVDNPGDKDNPGDTDKPVDNNPGKDTPKTGDNTPIAAYTSVLIIAAVAIVVLIINKPKVKKN